MTKRRSFLKSLVAAPVALAPAAYSFAQEISPDTIWDKETDVVVVGFGGAGAAAAIASVQGGPKRNINAQVLNALDEPIPHLFCAGELGSIWGTIYQGSSNIAECLVFGRIAGRQAAQTKNWQ